MDPAHEYIAAIEYRGTQNHVLGKPQRTKHSHQSKDKTKSQFGILNNCPGIQGLDLQVRIDRVVVVDEIVEFDMKAKNTWNGQDGH